MAQFGGVDYFNTESLLTAEEKLIRDTVRNFVSQEVIPVIEEHYSKGTFPIHFVKKMGELESWAPPFPPNTDARNSTAWRTV